MQWAPGTDKLIPALYGSLYHITDGHGATDTLTPDEIDALAAKDLNQKKNTVYTRLSSSLKQIDQALVQAGMKPLDRKTALKDSITSLLGSIAAEHIRTRTITSFNTGWGLTSSSFECKETGDYQTKVLFGLGANSQKLGEKEHRSILGYLYNMDTDGVNTRKFIFPVITTKDAPGFHEWSFLGGLFERSE